MALSVAPKKKQSSDDVLVLSRIKKKSLWVHPILFLKVVLQLYNVMTLKCCVPYFIVKQCNIIVHCRGASPSDCQLSTERERERLLS